MTTWVRVEPGPALIETDRMGAVYTRLGDGPDERWRIEGPALSVYLPTTHPLVVAAASVLRAHRDGWLRCDPSSLQASCALDDLAAAFGGALGAP